MSNHFLASCVNSHKTEETPEPYFPSSLARHVNFSANESHILSSLSMTGGSVVEWFRALGRVVRKPVNTNPGLKVNPGINFSCIKMFFTSYISRKLRLLKLKTEGQTIKTENLTEKLQT